MKRSMNVSLITSLEGKTGYWYKITHTSALTQCIVVDVIAGTMNLCFLMCRHCSVRFPYYLEQLFAIRIKRLN